MLTKEDLGQIRELFDERFTQAEHRLEERLSSRLEERLTTKLDDRFAKSEQRLSSHFAEQLGEFIEHNINPQFEELRREIQFIRSHMITRFDLEDRLADFRLSFKGIV